MYREIKGDLIKLAQGGDFEVIAHGCNCFEIMGAGIAPQMAKAFGCDKFPMEHMGNLMTKLGNIDYQARDCGDDQTLWVVNAYTQYGTGTRKNGEPALDYEALQMCFRKMNHIFKGYHIGLPKIGCGLAGGNWDRVKKIIQSELTDMDVTVVHYFSL